MVGDLHPPDILFDILVRLPPEDLLRCLCVSKAWNATIHDQQFIKSHLQRSLETNEFRTLLIKELGGSLSAVCLSLPFHDENDMVGNGGEGQVQTAVLPQLHKYNVLLGHCNGVVCIRDSRAKEIALWNPSIQKLKKIPTAPTTESSTLSGLDFKPNCAFGYDSANDDYKIVQAVEFSNVGSSNQVDVYSLKSNSWKTIQSVPYIGYQFVRQEMVFLNGAVIWLMQNKTDWKKHIIATLDLATDNYHEFPAPVDREHLSMLQLGVLGGSLCIIVDKLNTRNDVWIMKEYGVTKSWTLLYSMKQEAAPRSFLYCKPLFISKNGEMALLKMSLLKTDFKDLFWFDIRKKSSKQVGICGLPSIFDANICSGSLLLLDGDSVIVQRQDQVPSTDLVVEAK